MPHTYDSSVHRAARSLTQPSTPLPNTSERDNSGNVANNQESFLAKTPEKLTPRTNVIPFARAENQNQTDALRSPAGEHSSDLTNIESQTHTEAPRFANAAQGVDSPNSQQDTNAIRNSDHNSDDNSTSDESNDSEKSPAHKKARQEDNDLLSDTSSDASDDAMSEDEAPAQKKTPPRTNRNNAPFAFTIIGDDENSDDDDDKDMPPGLSRLKAAILNSVIDSLKTDINSEAFFVEIFGEAQGQKMWQEIGNRTSRQLDVLTDHYSKITEKLSDMAGDPHVPQELFVSVMEMGSSILRDIRKQPQLVAKIQANHPEHFNLPDPAEDTTALTTPGFFDDVDKAVNEGLKQQPKTAMPPLKRMKQEQLASQMVKIQAFNKLYEEARSQSLQSRVESSASMETIPGTEAHFVKIKGLSLDDLIVPPATKSQFEALIDQIKNADVYKRSGARQVNGILLYGPPGTGKTLAARVLASSANEDAAFISCSGASFHKPLLGAGAGAVKAVFESARARSLMTNKPCFVFIDEFDSLAKSRRGDNASGNEASNTLMELLHQLDGLVGTDAEVILIAATNHRDRLDAASIRPGRIDKHILMETPHQEGREALLNHFQKKQGIDIAPGAIKKLAQDANTGGYSGADLEQLVNEGARLRAYQHGNSSAPLPQLSLDHLMEARKRIANGDRSELPGNATLINASGDDKHMPTLDNTIVDKTVMEAVRDIVENFNDQEARDLYQMSPHSTIYMGGQDSSKRSLVKAIAGSLKAPLIIATPTELTSKYVGESMKNAKALLSATQGYPVKPVVLLLEDLDQMLQGDHSHNEERNMVNSLLSGINDLKENPSVLVVGTGRADAKQLGQRLNRDMHTLFQQVVDMPQPDEHSRKEIIEGLVSQQRNVFSQDLDTQSLAKATKGLCHHDFVDIIEDAKNHANQRRRTARQSGDVLPLAHFKVSMDDIQWAMDKRLAQKDSGENRILSMYT